MLRGFARTHADAIVLAARPFASLGDFIRRTGLRGAALKKLAQADAFGSLQLGRRVALWQALSQGEQLPLFDTIELDEPPAALPRMSPLHEVLADYSSAGLTLRSHPMAFLRPMLDKRQVVPADKLPALPVGRVLAVAGVVLLRQRPSTANGITFVTIEDETGMTNLIVRQDIWERYRRVARTATVMLAHGALQKEVGVIHLLVSKLEDLSPALAQLHAASRNFR
jgi:error-prone DNA polymerase